jgi:hypothetical protein
LEIKFDRRPAATHKPFKRRQLPLNTEARFPLPVLKGKINYTVWSEVFSCPHCSKEIIYFDAQTTQQFRDASLIASLPLPYFFNIPSIAD